MTPQELRERTADFALRVSRVIKPLFRERAAQEAADQLARAAPSTASNYRAACLARSHAEFCSKIGTSLEECDESVFWLEYLKRAELSAHPDLDALIEEGHALCRILGASKRTSQRRSTPKRPRR